VQALKSSPRAAGPAGELPAGVSFQVTPTTAKVSSVELAPMVGQPYSVEFVTPGTEKPQPLTTRPAGGADPLAEAEAALKRLRENPKDQQAADALEKALQRLKERKKPEGQTGNPAKRE